MRIIGNLKNEQEALLFSRLLISRGISSEIEVIRDVDWGSSNYGQVECRIWIRDEDRTEEAADLLEKFELNPHDPIFRAERTFETKDEPVEVIQEKTGWDRQPMGLITKCIIALCCLLFVYSELTSPKPESNSIPFSTPVFASDIEKSLLFDYPETYVLVDKFIKLYGYEALKNPSQLPAEGRYLVQKINQTPYWRGLYDYVLQKQTSQIFETPMFEKIRSGEFWRLFTPCLLHGNLIHLFFNMVWLIILGKQLEQRLHSTRYLLFILMTGIFSNTAQYLMSGANFIGISGVVAAMVGYIWVRQKKAPWEGYQLDRMTLLFVVCFIFGIAGLQAVGFVLQYFFQIDISPGVANTAHLAGAAAGIGLGQLEFFKWK